MTLLREANRCRFTAIIEFSIHRDATKHEVATFIEDSLEWAGGRRHPEDPLFDSLSKVKVKSLSEKEAKSTPRQAKRRTKT